MNEFFKNNISDYINNGLVSVQKHPSADLYIYNYTPKVQYEKLWDEITLQTRGLILDSEMNIVAKPFGKFFNIEELTQEEIPNLSFDAFEKMDGSLGILYWIGNIPYIATRGSFESDQAKHATEILHLYYSNIFHKIDKNSTYLFEIIYPENRIVIDYGDLDDIVLLTIINNKTNEERVEDIGFTIVKKYDGVVDFNKIRELNEDNKEGFVIRFSNGFRMKIKYEEYVRLHRILTNVSNVVIWEYLRDNKSLEELVNNIPDEFYNWVKKTKEDLLNNFNTILDESKSVYKILETRKDTALYFLEQKYPSVLFCLLDGKEPDKTIWKMIKPKYSRPFKNNEDDE